MASTRMEDNGTQTCYKVHRDGDLPIYYCGAQFWYKDGMLHRDVGPAYVSPTNQYEFYEYGVERGAGSSLGETMRARPPASWSPVLCFI